MLFPEVLTRGLIALAMQLICCHVTVAVPLKRPDCDFQ
ncbi:hypothetical protein MiSe_74480 [Microseira wollei NIES-4236]|uniref:Uncharacterized protein n=1 Tax=Microseira wollei NIES-4236 TaxID=2530354 RepID=A0AAV3XNF1_9CYAN|nr:hypothetical protein MiSe_74480 [Microseira wollei NIES-4236]